MRYAPKPLPIGPSDEPDAYLDDVTAPLQYTTSYPEAVGPGWLLTYRSPDGSGRVVQFFIGNDLLQEQAVEEADRQLLRIFRATP